MPSAASTNLSEWPVDLSTGRDVGLPGRLISTYRGEMRVVLVLLCGLIAFAPQASAVDVVVEEDRYVGSHAIIVPASVDPRTRAQLSECAGCSWRFVAPCIDDPDAAPGGCSSVVRGCPAGRELLRVWFMQRPGPWEERGLVCVTESDIVPVARVSAEARERFERRVPGSAPSCEPPAGAVTQIPLVCTSGFVGGRPSWNESLLGVDVRIEAVPMWTWQFDPGAELRTASPGGTYPDMSVSHTYRTAGPRTIIVTTEWMGSYTADGLGPFSLPVIRHEASVAVDIGQARAVLTRP